jgi:hypothetical protein
VEVFDPTFAHHNVGNEPFPASNAKMNNTIPDTEEIHKSDCTCEIAEEYWLSTVDVFR